MQRRPRATLVRSNLPRPPRPRDTRRRLARERRRALVARNRRERSLPHPTGPMPAAAVGASVFERALALPRAAPRRANSIRAQAARSTAVAWVPPPPERPWHRALVRRAESRWQSPGHGADRW